MVSLLIYHRLEWRFEEGGGIIAECPCWEEGFQYVIRDAQSCACDWFTVKDSNAELLTGDGWRDGFPSLAAAIDWCERDAEGQERAARPSFKGDGHVN